MRRSLILKANRVTMHKNRTAAATDKNQPEIVEALRKMGFSVETDHDDLLIGDRGLTFWYELKDDRALDKDGKIRESEIKPSQKKLRAEFKGHYKIVSSLDQILDDIRTNRHYLGLK